MAAAARVLGMPPDARGRHLRYRLHGFTVDEAAYIGAVLADPRGWRALGFSFAEVDAHAPAADFDVWLTPAPDMARMFPYAHLAHMSVTDRRVAPPQVHLHASNWHAPPRVSGYAGHVLAYRRYLVNHEVGHVLGAEHAACPARGAPAPIMLQQTRGTGACVPSPHVV